MMPSIFDLPAGLVLWICDVTELPISPKTFQAIKSNTTKNNTTEPDSFERSMKVYEIFREYVRNEDALANYRTTWFLAFQPFFAAAVSAPYFAKVQLAGLFGLWAPRALAGIAIALALGFYCV